MPHLETTTPSTSWDTLPVGTIVDGRYRITGKLGEGGFAVVYSAIHESLGRPVALKVLDLQGNSRDMASFHERFRREAQFAGTIRHGHVVHVHDFGIVAQNGQPYAAMDLLEGHDLEQELAANGPLEPARAMRLFDGALSGLAAAHELGIVHKDLKPSNLFLVHPGGPQEKMVVLDFGIARMYEDPGSKLTQTSQYTGTPAYAAPEYISKQAVSPALDVYQMGLIIAEAMTGSPVVQAGSSMAFFMAHCSGQQRIAPELLHTPLGQLLTRAVSVEPNLRPQNAEQFRQALRKVSPPLLTFSSRAQVAVRPQAPVSSPESFAPTEALQAIEARQLPPTQTVRPAPGVTKKKTSGLFKWLVVVLIAVFCASGCALAMLIAAVMTNDSEASTRKMAPSRGALRQAGVVENVPGHVSKKALNPKEAWTRDARSMFEAHTALGIAWPMVEHDAIMRAKAPAQGTREELLRFWKMHAGRPPSSINYTQSRKVANTFLADHSPMFEPLAGAMERWSEHLSDVHIIEGKIHDYWNASEGGASAEDDLHTGRELAKQQEATNRVSYAHSEAVFNELREAHRIMLQRASDLETPNTPQSALVELLLKLQDLHVSMMNDPRNPIARTNFATFAAQNMRLRALARRDGGSEKMDAVLNVLMTYISGEPEHTEKWSGSPHTLTAYLFHKSYLDVMKTYFQVASLPPLPPNPFLPR